MMMEQANQLKHKDARVKMVHEVVSAIKVVVKVGFWWFKGVVVV